MIKCPCNKRCLGKWLDMESAHGDILRHGFLPGYTEWTVHGEHTISLPPSQSTNVNMEETFFGQEGIRGLVRDALGINSLPFDNTQLGDITIEGDTKEYIENGDHGEEGVSYKRLLEEWRVNNHATFAKLCDIRTMKWVEVQNHRRFSIPQGESVDKKVDDKRKPNNFESFYLCYKTKDDTYLQEATRDMMVIADREISSKVKELVGLESIGEDTMVAQIARENKKVESYRKQVETQGLQMKNMEQKLNEVYGMLILLPMFPDLDNVAFTFAAAAGTCDKQLSLSTSPSPFMDEDHYSPIMMTHHLVTERYMYDRMNA
uniref:Basic helix-loop-helix leucine zipper transcription factor n=1 Tax=Tanacetum cinerariifolium TaxID=118510 RepID=A0A699GLH1_TANCI|nr:basic helix-loop-helix leucine zipper transcription factor [Tanacetum cinerariifolium]